VTPFNDLVAGFSRPLTRAELLRRLAHVPAALRPAAAKVASARAVAPSGDPLTDDRAPVEWLTDQMIVRYAAAGANG
jgi:hypothetical protein